MKPKKIQKEKKSNKYPSAFTNTESVKNIKKKKNLSGSRAMRAFTWNLFHFRMCL